MCWRDDSCRSFAFLIGHFNLNIARLRLDYWFYCDTNTLFKFAVLLFHYAECGPCPDIKIDAESFVNHNEMKYESLQFSNSFHSPLARIHPSWGVENVMVREYRGATPHYASYLRALGILIATQQLHRLGVNPIFRLPRWLVLVSIHWPPFTNTVYLK